MNSYTALRPDTIFSTAARSQQAKNVPGGLHGGLQVKHRLNKGANLEGLYEHLSSVDIARSEFNRSQRVEKTTAGSFFAAGHERGLKALESARVKQVTAGLRNGETK